LGQARKEKLRNITFLGFSVVIGILAASGAVLFRTLIELFQNLFWASGTTFLEKLIHSPWWLKLLVPTAVGLFAGPLITFLAPEIKGTGVPEVIFSVAARESTIRHRVTLLKSVITSLLIGGGASVGREGPIAQIGASVGSSMAQLFKLGPEMRRAYLAAGAAAGIAATFNAPMAGTLFAVEIILLDIEIVYLSHIVISAVTGSVLSRLFWGEFPAFNVPVFHPSHPWELPIYLLLGCLAGFAAIGFVRMITFADAAFQRIPIPDWTKPALGGLLLGCLALKLPEVMGVGYDSINATLDGTLSLKMAFILLAAKMAATSLCIGSGMSGGIFAPSLVLGATLGTTISLALSGFFPELGLSPSNYALAGMGALVAGSTLAPITAIMTIFEITYNYRVMLPLMAACISSTLIVKYFLGYSAYEMKLLKRGVNIVRGHDVGILRSLRAREFMDREFENLKDATPIMKIIERFMQSSYPHFVVLNEQDALVGMLSPRDLKSTLDKLEELKDIVVAADLMTTRVISLSAEDNLEKALYLFEDHKVSLLPVTDPGAPRHVLGVLKKDKLLQAYRERVLKDRILSIPAR